MLSQTAEYALRATLHIARQEGDVPVRAEEVAAALDVPRNYLSKILHALGRRGVLTSTRGPQGGFRLAVPAEKIRIAQIVEVFDPDILDERSRCLLGRTVCSDRNPCVAHERWKQVSATFRDFFRKTTLAELASPGAPAPPGGDRA
jgi:Rrf2 family protein